MERYLNNRPGSRRGFSLIEAMIALVVMMVVLAGIVRMFTAAQLCNRKARNLRLAAYCAQQVIERARVTSFDQITAANFPSPFDIKDPLDANRVVGQGQVSIQPYPTGSPGTNPKIVVVSTKVGYTRRLTANATFRTVIAQE